MTNKNHPNSFRKFFGLIKIDRYTPNNIPITEIVVKVKRNFQSILKFSTSPMNPINDFTAIISKEVAIALFIGNFAHITNTGMIKNPPPAPIIPVNSPTINP